METPKKPELVLLIDDDENINYINKRLLEIHGFGNTITTFMSAADALSFLQESYMNKAPLPDLIFLDIMMPLMNGFEFLEEFDKLEDNLTKQCKIVMLSSTELDKDIAKVKSNKHVIDFYSKPLLKVNIEYLKSLWPNR